MKAINGIALMTTLLPLAAAAAGCMKIAPSQVQPSGDAEQSAIVFPSPIVNPATKAGAASPGTAYPEDESFGVFGIWYRDGAFSGWNADGTVSYIDGVEFFFDKDIDDGTPGKGGWVSDPAYYWVPTGKMSFAAWSPFSVKEEYSQKYGTAAGDYFSYGATGLEIKEFSTGGTGKSGSTANCDLMWSERVCDKSSSQGANGSYDGIDLVFHHALAALSFTSAESGTSTGESSGNEGLTTKIAITKIVLWGFNRQGTFSENISDPDNPTYKSSPRWSDLGTPYTRQDSLVVNSNGMTAYIIPQEITSEAKMKVYYTVQLGDNPPLPVVSDPVSLAGNAISGTSDILSEWKMGTRYNYSISVSGSIMIRFSVDIRQWEEQSDITK